jgi:putative transposase
MSPSTNPYKRHRFPPAIIQYAVWLYHRFNLSHRSIEDLLAERGIEVTYESVRLWSNKFGPLFSKGLKRRHPGFGDTFLIDEVFVTIAGQRHYLWRAVDQDGDVIDVYLQTRRNAEAAKRFFRRLLRSHGRSPRKIVTDKLGSYGVARRELMPAAIHDTDHYANNRAELSHQPTRVRERGMRGFSSPEQAQRFLSVHAVVYSLLNLQRHLVSAAFYRLRRARAFECWTEAIAG